MNTKDNGGPAFPHNGSVKQEGVGEFTVYWGNGMSLRDYFAAKALNGMISSAAIVDRTGIDKDSWATIAYSFADAMLKARES